MARKRTSRTNKDEVNFQEQFTGIAETLRDIASSFNSRSREQNDSKGEFKETNGIPTKLKTPINNNTRSLDKLSKSINQLMSVLGKADLGSDDKSTTNITKNIDVDSIKNKNIDVDSTKNKNVDSTPQSKAKGDYDNYLEKRRIERAKKDLPRAQYNYTVSIFQEIIKTLNPLKEMNKELGLSYKTLIGMNVEAIKLYTTSQGLSMFKYGISPKNLIEIQTAVAEISGTLNTLDGKELSDVGILSKKYQVDKKTMTEMSVLFSSMKTNSTDINKDLLGWTGILAEANDVAPAQAFKDLASASEHIALFGTKNVKNLAETVVLTKKWGMNIDKVYGTMEKMVFNLESSIEQLIEIQALTGADIDIEGMFQASLSGDVGAMAEYDKIIAGLPADNPIVKKVIGDWGQMSQKEREIAKAQAEEAKALAKEAVDEQKSAIDTMLRYADSAGSVLAGIGGVLSSTVGILYQRANLKEMKGLVKGVSDFSGKFSKSGEQINNTTKTLAGATQNMGKSSGFSGLLKKAFNPATILSVGVLAISLAYSFKIMSESIGGFADVGWQQALTGLASFSALLGGTIAILTTAETITAEMIAPIGIAIGVMAGLAYSFKTMGESIGGFADVGWQQALTGLASFSALLGGTIAILTTAGTITAEMIAPIGIAIGVMAGLAYSFKTMGEGMNLATTGLAELFKVASFSNFAGFIGTMSTLSALSPSLAISSTALAGGLWLLTKSLKPLVDLGKDSKEINKIPTSLEKLSNLDLSFAKIELNPLNDLIKKLKEVKDALSSINNEKVSFDIKRNVETVSNNNNSINNGANNGQLMSKLSELISAVKNKSEIGLDSTTMRKLESIFEG